jgi:glycosyltransferase involved in cell wall biosynthesis
MGGPLLSVVIASHNAAGTIGGCLRALRVAAEGREVEVLVADSSADRTAATVREQFPDVTVLSCPESFTVPQLRGVGVAAARGEIIALLDPYCIVGEGWVAELMRVHAQRPEPAVGGAVVLDGEAEHCVVRWATYFSEYAGFVPPLRHGPSADLAGSNIAYKRRAIGQSASWPHTGFWKTFVNRQLQADGHTLWSAPGLVVTLRKPIPFTEFLCSRYHHGRCFAAMRVAGGRRSTRWLRALSAFLLPLVALWRQTRSVWPKGRYRAKFIMTMPLLLLFHVNWAWGELWGYLRGPGRSCEQLFF